MEAIPTSLPSINVPKFHPKTHHLKPTLLRHHHPTPTPTLTKPPTSISSKPASPSHPHYIPNYLHSTSQPTPSPIHTHRNPATGYAAALIDAAICKNSLDVIHKDVKRMLKWLNYNEMLKGVMGDALVEEGVKGRVVKEVAEKGGFRRQVVAMVKMLVAKGKSGMVVQVMEEFEGIYYELNSNLRVVV